MPWDLFKSEYKAGLQKTPDDMGNVIADAYDKQVKTGFSSMGGTIIAGNKSAMAGLLTASFKSMGVVPFPLTLDNVLKLYWLGASYTNAGTVVIPGMTAAFILPEGQKNKSVDDFLNQLTKSFDTHLKQITAMVPAAPSPLPDVGYTVV